MNVYDHYGVERQDVDDVVRLLGGTLKVCFLPHESGFWGEYYLAESEDGTSYRLIRNFSDDEWQEEDFKECVWLLEANEAAEPDVLMVLLSGMEEIKFLYRSEVEEGSWMRRYVLVDGKLEMIREVIM